MPYVDFKIHSIVTNAQGTVITGSYYLGDDVQEKDPETGKLVTVYRRSKIVEKGVISKYPALTTAALAKREVTKEATVCADLRAKLEAVATVEKGALLCDSISIK